MCWHHGNNYHPYLQTGKPFIAKTMVNIMTIGKRFSRNLYSVDSWRHSHHTTSDLILWEHATLTTSMTQHHFHLQWNMFLWFVIHGGGVTLSTVLLKMVSMVLPFTVRCCYNAINVLTNICKRHPIACPLGRDMGWLVWTQHLVDIVPQLL